MSRYLSGALGEEVSLLPLPFAKAAEMFGEKKVDFLIANPVIGVTVEQQYQGRAIATIDTQQGAELGGVIIARKDSGIKTLEDAKGKKVIAFVKSSAGAYIPQAYVFKKAGIDVEKDFASVTVAKTLDDIPMAVKAGLFDVGFSRTGILETLEAKGLLAMDEFVVVNKVEDSFPHVHSTPLFPERSVMAQSDMAPALMQKAKEALLALKADDPAAVKAEIKGFIEPKPMDALSAILKELKLAPFDKE